MYLDGLDGTDKKILRILIENARISYSDIGEKIGLSRVAVKTRVQSLEERGIIEEYTTIINPQKISGAISCYLEIETQPEKFISVSQALAQEDIITQIYRTTGNCSLHVHAVASSPEELEQFLHGRLDRMEGISKSNCHVILSRIKDVKGLRL